MTKILITEDDTFLANIYKEKCQAEGFEVQLTTDGKAAIEELKRNPPDLILLDLMLPDTDGVQVIKFIRGEPALQQLPVLVLTNAYVSSMVQAAWRAGADKCLTKAACTPNYLIGEVRALLKTSPKFAPGAKTAGADSGPSSPPRPSLLDKADEFQAFVHEQYLKQAPIALARLRLAFQRLGGSTEQARSASLLDIFRTVHALGGTAAAARFGRMSQTCSALEAMVKELRDKPEKINPSALRTIAQAVDFLGFLFEHEYPGLETIGCPLILVVDDEIISRDLVCSALSKANLRAVSVDDPQVALKLAEENRFDLVFMDVEMPGLNGFDLCKRLHGLAANQTTPVVFVTGLKDFETRTRSTLSGGADLIGKPFLLIELAVKALPYIFRSQMQGEGKDQQSAAA
jgi:DNA-binding response OmpR family regulator